MRMGVTARFGAKLESELPLTVDWHSPLLAPTAYGICRRRGDPQSRIRRALVRYGQIPNFALGFRSGANARVPYVLSNQLRLRLDSLSCAVRAPTRRSAPRGRRDREEERFGVPAFPAPVRLLEVKQLLIG